MPTARRGLVRALGTLAVSLWATALPPVAAEEVQTYRLTGLSKPAEIVVDRWGVPHIYAAEHYDAFFVQGFNAARDRLWQIDLWRRRGLGRLAEVLGPDYVEQDRATRLFLYRGDMYREWLAYGSDAKRIAEAFVAGVNAYVDLVESRPELLPPEFELLEYGPARWEASDVVRIRGHGLWRNVASEVKRAQLYCRFGAEADAARSRLTPEWTPRVPEGLDPCDVPEGVLDLYRLAKAPVGFAGPESARAHAAWRDTLASSASNNWAVAPSRTTTGRPILADDPHRGHAVPSLRYIAHLVAPGLDVIGAGEPALPGISIGHNDRIAFGLTIFAIDQEDLYVYETRPGAPSEYRYDGRWVPFEHVVEEIRVRGEEPRSVTLEFTRHGPVVLADPETRRAFAVRAAWLEPGMAPYFGSIEYMRARNWREFVAALNRWGAPAENQVYADVEGNIGYKPAGLFPRRTSFDGLLPVPGDGRYEWEGYFDMDALPEEYNPERGFVATANAMNLPPDYPIAERRVGFEWSAPWRHRRVFEVLGADEGHSVEASLRLQRDYLSVLAREVIASLPEVEDPDARRAHALLRGWDARLEAESAEAALYALWFYRHFRPGLIRARFPGDAFDLVSPMDTRSVLSALQENGPRVQGLVDRTLAEAFRDAQERMGADPEAWAWGTLHRIAFEHPLQGRASGELARQMALPDYPRGGSGYTTNNTRFDEKDFRVRAGASWRMVLDVGEWDRAWMTSAPGQSGDPRSPFYDNLLEPWARDGQLPLLYSRGAVEENAVLRIRLEPAGPP
jgi:penicillin amidase